MASLSIISDRQEGGEAYGVGAKEMAWLKNGGRVVA
jgi:hypothetical protein